MAKRGMTPERAKLIRASKGIEETKLQQVRVNKGFSQNDLAVASGVSINTIQCYEQRKRPIDKAQLKTISAICEALECNIEDILEDKALIDKYKLVK